MSHAKLLFSFYIIISFGSCRTHSINDPSSNIIPDIGIIDPSISIPFIDKVYQHILFDNDGSILTALQNTISSDSKIYTFVSLYQNDPNKAIYSFEDSGQKKFIGVQFSPTSTPSLLMYKQQPPSSSSMANFTPWNNSVDVSFNSESYIDPKTAFAIKIHKIKTLYYNGRILDIESSLDYKDSWLTDNTTITPTYKYELLDFIKITHSTIDTIYKTVNLPLKYIGLQYNRSSSPKLTVFMKDKNTTWSTSTAVNFTAPNEIVFKDIVNGHVLFDNDGSILTASQTTLFSNTKTYTFKALDKVEPHKAIYSFNDSGQDKFIGVKFDPKEIPPLTMYKQQSSGSSSITDLIPWNKMEDVSFNLNSYVNPKTAFKIATDRKKILQNDGTILQAYSENLNTTIGTTTSIYKLFSLQDAGLQDLGTYVNTIYTNSGGNRIGVRYTPNSFPKLTMFKKDQTTPWDQVATVEFINTHQITFLSTIDNSMGTSRQGFQATGNKIQQNRVDMFEYHSLYESDNNKVAHAIYKTIPQIPSDQIKYIGIEIIIDLSGNKKFNLYLEIPNMLSGWSTPNDISFDSRYKLS